MNKKGTKAVMTLVVTFMVLLLIPITAVAASSPTTISVYIDNKPLVSVDKPFIERDRTLVPMRAFFEALGAGVEWDAANSAATGTRSGKVVRIPIGSTAPTINGVVNKIDVPARIVNGRTYIPLRFVGEAFGDKVIWEGSTRSIYITRIGGGGLEIPTIGATSKTLDIIFLHRSTGGRIWSGGMRNWFADYNVRNGTQYKITEKGFPAWDSAYGYINYPFDYYNIWVKNAGEQPFKDAPTLEMLTKQYDVIIFKHCYSVSAIKADGSAPNIDSDIKTLGNYKLQYEALKTKLHTFPQTKFIVWTPPALIVKHTNQADAQRAEQFSKWLKTEWDTPGDNIYLWDFRSFQVEGGLYFKDSYAVSANDSHPNPEFSKTVAPYFCQRIVDVIAGNGDKTSLTGK